MTEIKPRKSIGRRMIIGMMMSGILAFGVFFMMKGCSSAVAPDIVNLVLKEDGKTYVFSPLGNFIVKTAIEKGESPNAIGTFRLFEDEDLYVEPGNMGDLVELIAGRGVIYPFEEKSYDGYVASPDSTIYESSQNLESTETIGVQVAVHKAIVQHPTKDKELVVEWHYNQKTGEYRAVKNCELKSFWIQTNPSPGETVISSEDFLVVNFKVLTDFLYPKAKFEYDEEVQVLYIIR